MAIAFDIGLMLLIVGIGLWMIMARDVVIATIIFVIYGLLVAIAWVRLSAVDVALTEAAIGSGLTGMLLLGAASRVKKVGAPGPYASWSTILMAAVLCAMISAGLATAVHLPTHPAPTLAPMAMESLDLTGLGNPVAAVLFAYRALDTLLEKVVLLIALIGVHSLAPDRLWGGVPSLDYVPPNDILVFFAQTLPPFGIVFAIYMTWTGASNPGGAFQGGTVLAVMWLLVMMAGIMRPSPIRNVWLRWLLICGPALFLAIGFAGFAFAEGFLAYPVGYAKALIVVVEVALAVSIAVTLGLLTAGPPQRMQK